MILPVIIPYVSDLEEVRFHIPIRQVQNHRRRHRSGRSGFDHFFASRSHALYSARERKRGSASVWQLFSNRKLEILTRIPAHARINVLLTMIAFRLVLHLSLLHMY